MSERRWRKSSYSGNQGDCVEVSLDRASALVRDTKDPSSGHLTVSPQAWEEFLGRL